MEAWYFDTEYKTQSNGEPQQVIFKCETKTSQIFVHLSHEPLDNMNYCIAGPTYA